MSFNKDSKRSKKHRLKQKELMNIKKLDLKLKITKLQKKVQLKSKPKVTEINYLDKLTKLLTDIKKYEK